MNTPLSPTVERVAKIQTSRAETAETAKSPDHVRILLSEAASKRLTETGESAFMVASMATHPGDPTPWILHLVPIPKAQADGACRVALGTHRAVKVKTTT